MLGALFLNRYQAARFLGQGSMGSVYLARDAKTGDEVVVKVIHPHVAANPDFRQFFDRETKSLAHLRHPCVVALLDAAFNDAHGPCLVMEYIRGISLESLLECYRTLTVEHTFRLLIPLCRALNAGHARSIIHRDLKPANLMVTDPDKPNSSLKVMDFGLALLNAKPHIPLDKLRGGGTVATYGTPMYVAPDGLRGSVIDHRADLYSVGVILYELLVGQPPFPYRDSRTILNAHVTEPPPKFSAVRPGHDIPPEVEALVRRCLDKYPNERPQSAREIAEAFGQAVGRPLTDADFPPDEEQLAAANADDSLPLPIGSAFMVVHRLDAWMPEPIAVVKLRGFVEDEGGDVLDSRPGLIRVQLGQLPSAPAPPTRAQSLIKWVEGRFRTPVPPRPLPDPIDLRLYMSRPEDARLDRLQLTIVFQPLEGSPLKYPDQWHARCDSLIHDLRSYLMAK